MSVKKRYKKQKCSICGRSVPKEEVFPLSLSRYVLKEKILEDHPDISWDGVICRQDHRLYRVAVIEDFLRGEVGELSEQDHAVLRNLRENHLSTKDIDRTFENQLTFGERVSDHLSEYAGSWSFIILFFVILILWMGVNTYFLQKEAFDPYPYILLNLLLSCLAAVQAPVILMSQNRQEERDQMKAQNDYHINLISELQLRQMHEKIDLILKNQWERFGDLQKAINAGTVRTDKKPSSKRTKAAKNHAKTGE